MAVQIVSSPRAPRGKARRLEREKYMQSVSCDCGNCDHSLGLVQMGLFCSHRNTAARTCYVEVPVGNTKGASVWWEEKVCSPPKVEGKRPKCLEVRDSWYYTD